MRAGTPGTRGSRASAIRPTTGTRREHLPRARACDARAVGHLVHALRDDAAAHLGRARALAARGSAGRPRARRRLLAPQRLRAPGRDAREPRRAEHGPALAEVLPDHRDALLLHPDL